MARPVVLSSLLLALPLVLALLTAAAHSAAVSQGVSPCPSIFRYATDSVKQQIYGIVDTREQPVDKVGTLELHLSIGGELRSKYVGSIESIEDSAQILSQFGKGRGVQYRVNFPLQDPLPKITKVVFNGRDLCTGPGDRGSFVSSVTLRHFLRSDSCKENCDRTKLVPSNLNLDLSPPAAAAAAPSLAARPASPVATVPVASLQPQQQQQQKLNRPLDGLGGAIESSAAGGSPGVQHEYQRTIERKEETNNPHDNSTSVKYIREEITYRKQVITPGGAASLQDDQLQLPAFVTN